MVATSYSTLLTLTTPTQSELNTKQPCKNMKEVKQLQAQITKKGLSHRPMSYSKLISSCADIATPESLEYAKKAYELFERDGRSRVSLYMLNSLIRGYCAAGFVDEAILTYAQIVGEGVTPDRYTFRFVLSGCAKADLFLEGIQLHGSVLKLGLEEDLCIQNCLIHIYAVCGEIDFAKKLFNEMSERDVVSWTCLICGCARKDRPKEAVSLFFEMVDAGIKPNSVTLVGAISACAKLRDLDLGEKVSSYISKTGLTVNTFLANALVDMYMKCGATDRAKQLFGECVDKNLESYNALLSNYVRQGMEREALATLVEMLQRGQQPDRVTMISVAKAISQLGDFAFGRQFHGYVMRNGLDDWHTVGNAIIDMYSSCGKQELACRVFDRMSTKSVVSWNCLITGFAKNGDVDSALKLFNEMLETDVVTWNTMIGALVRGSLFDDAIELFKVMQNEGVKANKVTMMSIASACGYLGDLDLAKWIYHCVENQGIHRDLKLNRALADMFCRCGDTENAMQMFDKVKNIDVSSWTRVIEILNEIPKRQSSSDQEDKSIRNVIIKSE
ncbi:pentatricopeptide repeat-containing protein At3g22690-like [Rhododendron vialii]|uniref:pentatricopeptide repeat-containing protein At3g22690-like n=1 Tax=Rhododendron vialii TaxID=182163 RepID=UPI00266047DF|nr:pentatricopeptide repeat-containing protein At3g22690-like [Rhododendron vialii]XP_058193530.1 pentatricopeptide repeat-containing protein At3g22690-like [Rhododendron vialii]XP_058193539.1 pentatricopeptide repeat-containing protein At3g22690-like [Rhododendron vialii]